MQPLLQIVSGQGIAFAVLRRGDPDLLVKGAVKGAQGVKAHLLADAGDVQIRIDQ